MKVQLVVRYVNGLKDTIIDTDSTSPIILNLPTSFIRQKIRIAHPDLAKKRLKLLHNGRVLMSHTDFTKEIKYLSTNLDTDDNNNNLQSKIDEPIKIYFHCIIGDDLNDKELQQEESLDQQPIKSTTEAPKGFDRLFSQGFSNEDIEDLRSQFFRLHGSQLPSNATNEQIRELEDRWIDSSVNHEIDEFPANIRLNLNNSIDNNFNNDNSNINNDNEDNDINNSNNNPNNFNNNNSNSNFSVREQMIRRDTQSHKETLIGVCVGFALGGLALILLFMDVGGIFQKRTRMAVISGVIVNLCFGILKLLG